MKKLLCLIVVLILLISAVPTKAQWRHAFPGYGRGFSGYGRGFPGYGRGFPGYGRAFPFRYPYPFYRFYPWWGYPYGLAWGFFGLAAFDSLVLAILGWEYLSSAYPYPPYPYPNYPYSYPYPYPYSAYPPPPPPPPQQSPPPSSPPYKSEWGQ